MRNTYTDMKPKTKPLQKTWVQMESR